MPLNSTLATASTALATGVTLAGADTPFLKTVQLTGVAVAAVCIGRAGERFFDVFNAAMKEKERNRNLPPEVRAEANTTINAEYARCDGVLKAIYKKIEDMTP